MSTKVAVVTGANKGIGYAIVRGLCKRFDGVVYLTARDVGRGEAALKELQQEGLTASFHQLDVTDRESIMRFRDYIKEKYGGIDVLINNAGIAFKRHSPEPAGVQAEETLKVNYYGIINVADILYPILKNGARVVNLSSLLGHLSMIPNEKIKDRLRNPNMTVKDLNDFVNEYIAAAKKGTHISEFGKSSYAFSKVTVSKLTFIQQSLLENRDIKVNAVHPGYVNTDLTCHSGPLTIDEGARSSLFMALDADDSIKGQYIWSNCKICNWDGEKPAFD